MREYNPCMGCEYYNKPYWSIVSPCDSCPRVYGTGNYVTTTTTNIKCVYGTPCGWCSKWDKKCDNKIPERGQRAKCNPVDDVIDVMDESIKAVTNKICGTESDHEWECTGASTTGTTYRCKKCGVYKTYPCNFNSEISITI